jgi:hypothetical protein
MLTPFEMIGFRAVDATTRIRRLDNALTSPDDPV